jgi:hypothetical protein
MDRTKVNVEARRARCLIALGLTKNVVIKDGKRIYWYCPSVQFKNELVSILGIIGMIAWILIAVLLVLSYWLYALIIKPKKLMSFYVRLFRQQGYSVIQMPYKALGSGYYQEWEENYKNKDRRDSFYNHRHEYYKYDVIVSNLFNKVHLFFMNP